MPRTDTPEGPPVQKKVTPRGPSKETLELGRECLDLLAQGVQRHLLHEVLHVTPKRVDHALGVMWQQGVAAGGGSPRRAHRAVSRRPIEVPGGWQWQDAAACRGLPAELFFGTDGERGEEKGAREQEAKAFCARCPVEAECGEFAAGGPNPAAWQRYGIWAGLNEEERAKLRKKQMKTASNERARQRAQELGNEEAVA